MEVIDELVGVWREGGRALVFSRLPEYALPETTVKIKILNEFANA